MKFEYSIFVLQIFYQDMRCISYATLTGLQLLPFIDNNVVSPQLLNTEDELSNNENPEFLPYQQDNLIASS